MTDLELAAPIRIELKGVAVASGVPIQVVEYLKSSVVMQHIDANSFADGVLRICGRVGFGVEQVKTRIL